MAALLAAAASGLVRNGSLSVTNAIAVDDEGSMLAVDGNLAFAADSAVDFGGCAEVPTGWIPIAAAGGTVTLPENSVCATRGASTVARCG